MALADFPIPEILFFINGNSFCGSLKGMNYRVTPVKADEEKGTEAYLEVFVWYGMLCSELSERVAEARFDQNADGLAAAVAWLREQYAVFCAAQQN